MRTYVDFVKRRAPHIIHAGRGIEAFQGTAHADNPEQLMEIGEKIVPVTKVEYQYVCEKSEAHSATDSHAETALITCYGQGADEFESYRVYVGFGWEADDSNGLWEMVLPGTEDAEKYDPAIVTDLMRALRQLEIRSAVKPL